MGNQPTVDYVYQNEDTSNSQIDLGHESTQSSDNQSNAALTQLIEGFNAHNLFDLPRTNVRRMASGSDNEMFGLRVDEEDDLEMSAESDVLDVIEHVQFPFNLDLDRLKVCLSEERELEVHGSLDCIQKCNLEISVDGIKTTYAFAAGMEQAFDMNIEYTPEAGSDIPILFQVSSGGSKIQSTTTSLTINEEFQTYFSVEKQTITMNNVCYNTYEIYGMGAYNEDTEECVICLTELRDTIVIPCRHFCVCHTCAEVLKYQSNKCPICRTHTSTMVQIVTESKDKTIGDSDSSLTV